MFTRYIYETTNHPRPWYKEKPELSKGTILEVEKEFGNFYGFYYRCNKRFLLI